MSNEAIIQAAEFRERLTEPDPAWKTGALFRVDDPRDQQLQFLPQVQEQRTAGLPPSFVSMPIEEIKTVYLQSNPSCVTNSICGAKSIEDYLDVKSWNLYNAEQMYFDCGGDGQNGIYADRALGYTRDLGALETATGRRWKIGSYMFAPRNAGQWRETLAAALISTGPCVIATLLPSTFGWDSNEEMTSAYHQMCLIGYDSLEDDGYALMLNSWGKGHGRGGFVRLRWRYLEGNDFQSGHVYGYKMVDLTDWVPPDPEPKPIPPAPDPVKPPALLKASYKQNGKKLVLVGDNFAQSAMVFVDGKRTLARWNDSGWMVAKKLSMSPGPHVVDVKNSADGKASSLSFQVE